MLSRFSTHLRFLLLILPVFGVFSAAQTACTVSSDDLSHEDRGGNGYGYGYHR